MFKYDQSFFERTIKLAGPSAKIVADIIEKYFKQKGYGYHEHIPRKIRKEMKKRLSGG